MLIRGTCSTYTNSYKPCGIYYYKITPQFKTFPNTIPDLILTLMIIYYTFSKLFQKNVCIPICIYTNTAITMIGAGQLGTDCWLLKKYVQMPCILAQMVDRCVRANLANYCGMYPLCCMQQSFLMQLLQVPTSLLTNVCRHPCSSKP